MNCTTLRDPCRLGVTLAGICCLALLLAGCASVSSPEKAPSDTAATQMAPDTADTPLEPTVTITPDGPDEELTPPASTSEGPAQALAQGLTIQPDCLVQIRIDEDPSLDGSYPVNDIGAVELGYIGPIILFNKTERESELKIGEVLRTRDFRKATVTVKIVRASYDKVQVAGAVNRAGLVRIGAGDTISLNDALLRAGGIKPSVRGAFVRIIRGGLTNAVSMALPGEEFSMVTPDDKPSVPDVALRNNDVAYVFSSSQREVPIEVSEKEIFIFGEMQGIQVFAGNEPCTIMHLMFKMGKLPPYANGKAIKIVRRQPDGSETEIEVNVEKLLKEGKPEDDVPLENRDRIIVPARRLQFF